MPILIVCLLITTTIINTNFNDNYNPKQNSTQKFLQDGHTEFPNLALIGNDNLTTYASFWGWEGNGSLENPFIITGYLFTSERNSLAILNTTLSFEVRDCITYGWIYLESVTGGKIVTWDTKGIECYLSTNCTLQNNIVSTSKGSGIRVRESSHYNISGNIIEDSGTDWENDEWGNGIEIVNSPHIRIFNNTITRSYTNGILISDSSFCSVEENKITNNGHSYSTSGLGTCDCFSTTTTTCDCSWSYTFNFGSGISLVSDEYTYIINNDMDMNAEGGLTIYGSNAIVVNSIFSNSSHDNFQSPSVSLIKTENTIVSNSIIGQMTIEECQYCTISECKINGGGVFARNSDGIAIEFSSLLKSNIQLYKTTGGKIIGNNIDDGFGGGINADTVRDLIISDNIINGVGNDEKRQEIAALNLSGKNCKVINNTIKNTNGIGIRVWDYWDFDSDQNEFFDNIFWNNTGGNALDNGQNNKWDNGIAKGNFWDDYNGDGNYEIPGSAGSVDHYPRKLLQNNSEWSSSPVPSSPTSVPNGPGINLLEVAGIAITIGSICIIIVFGFLLIKNKQN